MKVKNVFYSPSGDEFYPRKAIKEMESPNLPKGSNVYSTLVETGEYDDNVAMINSYYDATALNSLIEKFERTGNEDIFKVKSPMEGDFTNSPTTILEAHNMVVRARQTFYGNVELVKKYGNFEKFMREVDFNMVQDVSNRGVGGNDPVVPDAVNNTNSADVKEVK